MSGSKNDHASPLFLLLLFGSIVIAFFDQGVIIEELDWRRFVMQDLQNRRMLRLKAAILALILLKVSGPHLNWKRGKPLPSQAS